MFVILFLQNVIVTVWAQSMIAVMKKEFVSVSREQQGLSVISVCGDITGTTRVVNVSNCPTSAPLPLHPLLPVLPCASMLSPQGQTNFLKRASFPNVSCLNLKSNESIPTKAINWLCNPFVSICCVSAPFLSFC